MRVAAVLFMLALSSVAIGQAANNSTYVIEPEDGLHVAVFKEPDLTMSLPVRPDGKISMPLIGDVQAAGLTPAQLAASITEKLKQYVAHPYVTVVVTAMANQPPRGEIVAPKRSGRKILHTEPLQWREGEC